METGEPVAESSSALVSEAVDFTDDFRAFLNNSEYAAYDFDAFPGYGGFTNGATQGLSHDPVVFIHGNSDQAVGGTFEGWTASLDGFHSAGYSSGELYAMTWGPADASQAAYQYHSYEHLTRVRAFLLAVLDYTGANKIDVVSHSMGVTLARKAILGGSASDALAGGSYDLGPSIAAQIDTFVGVAGGNLGLVSCYYTGPSTPTCGSTNGLYPGQAWGWYVYGVSDFLDDINSRTDALADHVYSLWSPDDQVIGYGGLVWGSYTAQIPGQDGEIRLDDTLHFALRDSWAEQLSLVQ